MLVKRLEKNGKIKAIYASSTICGSIYETTTKSLVVIFKNGGQYRYSDVDLKDYTKLELSDSSGTAFNTNIKKKYTNFEKLDNIPATALSTILEEIETLKPAESVSSEETTKESTTKPVPATSIKDLVSLMNMLIAVYIDKNSLSETDINQLSETLSDYKNSTTN